MECKTKGQTGITICFLVIGPIDGSIGRWLSSNVRLSQCSRSLIKKAVISQCYRKNKKSKQIHDKTIKVLYILKE